MKTPIKQIPVSEPHFAFPFTAENIEKEFSLHIGLSDVSRAQLHCLFQQYAMSKATERIKEFL